MKNPNIYTTIIQKFDSKSLLLESLENTKKDFNLIGDDDYVQESYSLEVQVSGIVLGYIGILSCVMNLNPKCIFIENKLLIGFNKEIAIFSLDNLVLEKKIGLLSLFYEFILTQPHLVVLCEIALVAIKDNKVLWRIDTDLITNYKIDNHRMFLEFSDDAPFEVDLLSGNKICNSRDTRRNPN